ncbi:MULTISPECIES: helix-turn-helix domain-containing protein [unclassified Photorhabdus]|uniref:helix-turn-helix domain-containing protein n=1 Tax=unclassified Photorhabdus TaxID=2620880 RepID=UPI001EFEDB2D|nr:MULTISPECIES: helix-turn-helix domain-containing protein [unclassified Photorhabdus]
MMSVVNHLRLLSGNDPASGIDRHLDLQRDALKQAGLAAARARGRKPKLDDQQEREIKALLRDPDIQVAEVARCYGVSRTTLYKHVGVITPRQ